MYFASDNCAGAAPQITEALARHSGGFMESYGDSKLDAAVQRSFSELFERDVTVLTVSTGTAANSLALACAMKPGGIALAYREAHVIGDECGSPEFFMGAGRLEPLDGTLGKISMDSLAGNLERLNPPFLHHGRAIALTLTQATEAGTVYTVDEITALADRAKATGLKVHMDGARFANALATLNVSAAEMTWKAGVDMLSFGGTKNGCWCAEALVLFDSAMAEDARYLHKRSGQLFSKNRFVSAQFEAYLKDGLWLDMARHSNAMAQDLADIVRKADTIRLAWEPQCNEVFFLTSRATAERLRKAGATFHEMPAPAFLGPLDRGEGMFRLVTSFATSRKDTTSFAALLGVNA
ncbi:MAG: low specificity L-threonine aldolase [Rhizobiaceae bacterium]